MFNLVVVRGLSETGVADLGHILKEIVRLIEVKHRALSACRRCMLTLVRARVTGRFGSRDVPRIGRALVVVYLNVLLGILVVRVHDALRLCSDVLGRPIDDAHGLGGVSAPQAHQPLRQRYPGLCPNVLEDLGITDAR